MPTDPKVARFEWQERISCPKCRSNHITVFDDKATCMECDCFFYIMNLMEWLRGEVAETQIIGNMKTMIADVMNILGIKEDGSRDGDRV